MIPANASRALRMLTTFEGRDTRPQFWHYAGCVMVVWFVVSFVVNIAVVALSFVVGADAALDVLPSVLLGLTAVTALALAGVLAAAVTRRLHDRGLAGWWGLPPLVLLLVAMGLMAPFQLSVADGGEPSLGFFFAAFAAGLLYFVALGVLVLQLSLPGRPAADDPRPADGSTA